MPTVTEVSSDVSTLRKFEGRLREIEHEIKENGPRIQEAQKRFDSAQRALTEERRALEKLTQDADSLRSIVGALERLAGQAPTVDPSPPPGRPNSRPRPPATRAPDARPGLAKILAKRLRTIGSLTADEALAYVSTLPIYRDGPPPRSSIISRLGQLVREGVAVKNPDNPKVYELAQ